MNLAMHDRFFDIETIFVFIMSKSRANLKKKNFFCYTQSLQENNALAAANQSARTIVAI